MCVYLRNFVGKCHFPCLPCPALNLRIGTSNSPNPIHLYGHCTLTMYQAPSWVLLFKNEWAGIFGLTQCSAAATTHGEFCNCEWWRSSPWWEDGKCWEAHEGQRSVTRTKRVMLTGAAWLVCKSLARFKAFIGVTEAMYTLESAADLVTFSEALWIWRLLVEILALWSWGNESVSLPRPVFPSVRKCPSCNRVLPTSWSFVGFLEVQAKEACLLQSWGLRSEM